MKRHTQWILTLLTSAALALPVAVQAQSSPATASAAKKSAAKKPAAKKATASKAKKGAAAKKAKAATPPVESAQTHEQPLTEAELQTAQQVYTGTFPCELGGKVSVTADAVNPGFFTVVSGKRRYDMHPVSSRTGAIRMEDERRGAVWLQLATKSMLMDQKAGQRVADDCAAPAQKDYAAQLKDHPQQHQLLDGGEPAPAAASGSAPAASHAAPFVEPGSNNDHRPGPSYGN